MQLSFAICLSPLASAYRIKLETHLVHAAESVYFNESYQAASKAVDDVLGAYQGLLGRLR